MAQKKIILVSGEHKNETLSSMLHSPIAELLRKKGYVVSSVRSRLSKASVDEMRRIIRNWPEHPDAGKPNALRRIRLLFGSPEFDSKTKGVVLARKQSAQEYRELFYDAEAQQTSERLAMENPGCMVFSLHTPHLPDSHLVGMADRLKNRMEDNTYSEVSPFELNVLGGKIFFTGDPVRFINARCDLEQNQYVPQHNLFFVEVASPGTPVLPSVESARLVSKDFRSDVRAVSKTHKALLAKYIADQMHRITSGTAIAKEYS